MTRDNLNQAAQKFMHLLDRIRQLGPVSAPPKDAGISPSLLTLLNYSASAPGCGVQTMAEGLNLSVPTVSIGVRQLEKAGLMTRQPDPQDKRAVHLFLTPRGQQLVQQTYRFRCDRFEQLLSGLDSEERNTLLSLLERAVTDAEKNREKGEIS